MFLVVYKSKIFCWGREGYRDELGKSCKFMNLSFNRWDKFLNSNFEM